MKNGINWENTDYHWMDHMLNNKVMTREEKLEAIVKLFAKDMHYGDWKWETPNERVIEMLMREVDLYPFWNEDEMILQTKVDDELYERARKVVPVRGNAGI